MVSSVIYTVSLTLTKVPTEPFAVFLLSERLDPYKIPKSGFDDSTQFSSHLKRNNLNELFQSLSNNVVDHVPLVHDKWQRGGYISSLMGNECTFS
jgi:hypothetical protein